MSKQFHGSANAIGLQMDLAEIVYENSLHPFNGEWREAIKRWQNFGYWIMRNIKGQLVIRGDKEKCIRVMWYAFGIKVFLYESEKSYTQFSLCDPDTKVIEYVDQYLPSVSERTRIDEAKYQASNASSEFTWRNGSRGNAVRLVVLKMRNHKTNMEQAVVQVLTSRLSSVCLGYDAISVKTLTGFVTDCWDECNRLAFGNGNRKDGEIERIYAALTGKLTSSSEIPTTKSEQLDLFTWLAETG